MRLLKVEKEREEKTRSTEVEWEKPLRKEYAQRKAQMEQEVHDHVQQQRFALDRQKKELMDAAEHLTEDLERIKEYAGAIWGVHSLCSRRRACTEIPPPPR